MSLYKKPIRPEELYHARQAKSGGGFFKYVDKIVKSDGTTKYFYDLDQLKNYLGGGNSTSSNMIPQNGPQNPNSVPNTENKDYSSESWFFKKPLDAVKNYAKEKANETKEFWSNAASNATNKVINNAADGYSELSNKVDTWMKSPLYIPDEKQNNSINPFNFVNQNNEQQEQTHKRDYLKYTSSATSGKDQNTKRDTLPYNIKKTYNIFKRKAGKFKETAKEKAKKWIHFLFGYDFK